MVLTADPSFSINPAIPPSGTGCGDCLAAGGWWVHLRRCAQCGYIGCCDTSPSQHASAHYRRTGHRIVQSFEPGEWWMWDYQDLKFIPEMRLAEPGSRPQDQPVPAPAASVPANWRELIHT